MLHICFDYLNKNFYFEENQNRYDISIKNMDIFVRITIAVNKLPIYIKFNRLLDLMNYVFEYKLRYINNEYINNEYIKISNIYKNDLYIKDEYNKNIIDILPNKIINNILQIQIEFIHQYQYKIYHNNLISINVLSYIEYNYMSKYIYLYTNSVIKFKILNKTFFNIIKLHNENKSNLIKNILDNDIYLQNKLKLYNNIYKISLYNDILYNWKEIYFNYQY